MIRRSVAPLVIGSLLLLAACGSSGASSAPAASAPGGASSAPSAASAACAASSAAGAVKDSIKGFAFNPADISAKVGEVITFTNDDSAGHTATLADGSCTTGTIAPGSSGGLVFSAAGTYPFKCAIHPSMTGTFTIS